MANEMTVTMSISYAKGTDTWNKEVVSEQHDVSGTARAGGTYTTTGSAVNIPKGDIGSTVGFGYFRNIDSANSIDIGYDDSGFKILITLLAGMSCWLRFKVSTVPQAKQTGSGTPVLEYMLFSV
jgi:hypothetical protein